MTESETRAFNELNQDQKNEAVKRLVEDTNGRFVYQDILWTDGQVYTSFEVAGEVGGLPKDADLANE